MSRPAQIGRDQAREVVSLRDLSVPPPSYRRQSDGVPAFPAPDAQWGIATDDLGSRVYLKENWPFNPPITSPVPRRLLSPTVTYMGYNADTKEQIFRLPLPADAIVERCFYITYQKALGLPVYTLPNSANLEQVDGDELVLDADMPNSTRTVHGKMPEEVPQSRPEPKDPRQGYTLAHLLMKIVMKQHEYNWALRESRKRYPHMKWMFIVAVIKGKVNGVERWFPEIELRIPKDQWCARGS